MADGSNFCASDSYSAAPFLVSLETEHLFSVTVTFHTNSILDLALLGTRIAFGIATHSNASWLGKSSPALHASVEGPQEGWRKWGGVIEAAWGVDSGGVDRV